MHKIGMNGSFAQNKNILLNLLTKLNIKLPVIVLNMYCVRMVSHRNYHF